MCVRVQMLLFRLAASMGWLACLIYLLVSGNTSLGISDTWNQVVGLLFVVMTIAPLTLQMVTEVRTEKGGQVYKTWERRKKEKAKSRSELAQQEYRLKVQGAVQRGRSRSK